MRPTFITWLYDYLTRQFLEDLHEADYRNDPQDAEIEIWYASFDPGEELDYETRLDHAQKRFEQILADERSLKEKAEGLLKFSVTAAIALLTAARLLDPAADLFWWLLPPLAGFGWSTASCLMALRPATVPAPFGVREAVSSTLPPNKFAGLLAASYAASVLGQRFVNAHRSRWVERAGRGIIIALALLFMTTLIRQIT